MDVNNNTNKILQHIDQYLNDLKSKKLFRFNKLKRFKKNKHNKQVSLTLNSIFQEIKKQLNQIISTADLKALKKS